MSDRRSNVDHVLVAALGVLLFWIVSVASGRLTESRGLGWDGVGYARMVTEAVSAGSSVQQARPLIVLAARVPYLFGASVITAFTLINYISAFSLYLLTSLLLARHQVSLPVRVAIVANFALCISTSKMYGFYPVLIDLGALTVTTLAFYLSATDRHRWASVACVAASAAREFGLATAVYGIGRAVRQRRFLDAACYVPGLATLVAIQWSISAPAAEPAETAPLLVAGVENLRLWLNPAFALVFVYFAVTLFGGVSALLLVRSRWSWEQLRKEPELLAFIGIVVAAGIAGNADIWRYLVFTLPAAAWLIGRYFGAAADGGTYRTLLAILLFTAVTQRPFQSMDLNTYFADWFPLYYFLHLRDPVPGLDALWVLRVIGLALLMTALFSVARRNAVSVPS